jgi:hypothetical protein
LNKKQIDHLVKNGERKDVDFKRLLSLDTARKKSEFIKDISSIANSTDYIGYLIIGVEDDGEIVGSDPIEEERIQQIAHGYIDPPIDIEILMFEKNNKNISILVIKPTLKPHKISRDSDNLEKGTVYVRHGTVTFKATPDEIVAMSESKKIYVSDLKELRQGMKYSQTREIILNAGWQGNKKRWQDVPEYGQVRDLYYNNGWYEIDDCSGTGLAPCRFEFHNVHGNKLVVIAEGECSYDKNETCDLDISYWLLE